MHASPSFQMWVCHFGMWRAACGLLVVLAGAVTAAWLVYGSGPADAWAAGSVMVWVLASAAVLAHAWRLQRMRLHWDTQRWHLGQETQEAQAGRLLVAMDLGGWMLLRFVADDAPVLRRGRWLPVQRRGHEAAWHALRCTVYCARPVSLPTVAPF